jgi:hypothetical protein
MARGNGGEREKGNIIIMRAERLLNTSKGFPIGLPPCSSLLLLAPVPDGFPQNIEGLPPSSSSS